MSHTSKHAALQDFMPGTAEYVVAHAQWQKRRGRRPSETFLGFKNPAQAFHLAQNFVFLKNVMEPIAELMPDSDAADRGEKLFKAGKYAEAVPYLKQATGWYSDVEYPHMLGLAYARQPKPDYVASMEAFLTALHKPDATIYDEVAKPIYKDLAAVLDAASGKPEAAVFSKRISAILEQNSNIFISFGLEEIYDELHSVIVGRDAAKNQARAHAQTLVPVLLGLATLQHRSQKPAVA